MFNLDLIYSCSKYINQPTSVVIMKKKKKEKKTRKLHFPEMLLCKFVMLLMLFRMSSANWCVHSKLCSPNWTSTVQCHEYLLFVPEHQVPDKTFLHQCQTFALVKLSTNISKIGSALLNWQNYITNGKQLLLKKYIGLDLELSTKVTLNNMQGKCLVF